MTEDEFKRAQIQNLAGMNLIRSMDTQLLTLANDEILHLKGDLQRKDELIASANVLIDQLKAEVATLKQMLNYVYYYRMPLGDKFQDLLDETDPIRSKHIHDLIH